MSVDNDVFENFTKLLKAVADPSRRSIVTMLRHQGEMSVSDIATVLKISQPLASQHLRILKEAQAIKSRKEGQQVYYSLTSIRVCDALTDFLTIYQEELQ